MDARKPLLLGALNDLYRRTPTAEVSRAMTGHVSLVGAGPGDPGLLTRTAVARLRAADLVLYDALVDERILQLARRAQRFFVGKRAGRHALSQADIHAVMIRAAKRGRRVVRLKGGDPFVFGRGGEEALALQAAGVPFDVVPGVTSAVAAPALAGIPVTHRGLSAAFLVVSGHDEEVVRVGDRRARSRTASTHRRADGRSAAVRRSRARLLDRGWPRGDAGGDRRRRVARRPADLARHARATSPRTRWRAEGDGPPD